MPSIYQPRRPRASPLWQFVHHGRDDFLAHYDSKYRRLLGHLLQTATETLPKTQDEREESAIPSAGISATRMNRL